MSKSIYHVYQKFIWEGTDADLAKILYDSPPIAMYDVFERASSIIEGYRDTLWHLPDRMTQMKRELKTANREIGCLTPEVAQSIEMLEVGAIESAHQTVAMGGPGYILNKAAVEKGIPFFHGAAHGFEGRAMTIIPGKTACLQCVYHGAVTPGGKFPVIGTAPAVIGCIQATEVVKYIVGIGELLTDTLLVYDGLNMEFTEFKVKKDPNCSHCGHSGGAK